jgi:hypothetical protein
MAARQPTSYKSHKKGGKNNPHDSLLNKEPTRSPEKMEEFIIDYPAASLAHQLTPTSKWVITIRSDKPISEPIQKFIKFAPHHPRTDLVEFSFSLEQYNEQHPPPPP